MTKLLAVTLFAMGSLIACGPAEESPSAEPAANSPSERMVTGQALTWHLITTENCLDMWTTSCSASVPTGQCNVTEGSSCTGTPTGCWKVINSHTVERYRCY
ncbi:hypothetical protein COSO111634_16230 [Corallococcus soli]